MKATPSCFLSGAGGREIRGDIKRGVESSREGFHWAVLRCERNGCRWALHSDLPNVLFRVSRPVWTASGELPLRPEKDARARG